MSDLPVSLVDSTSERGKVTTSFSVCTVSV